MLVFRFIQNFRKFKEETLFDDGGGVTMLSKLICKVKQLLGRPSSTINRSTRSVSLYELKNSVYVIVKLFVLYFLSHAPDITDSLLGKINIKSTDTHPSDAYYFYSLEKDLFGVQRLTLTNPGWQVITAMAVFVFMALVKDITCCLWSISSCEFYHKKFSMTASQNMRLKTIKLVLNLLMEDICQVITQYFYFEKVLLEKSNFVYINAVVVFISGAFNLKVL